MALRIGREMDRFSGGNAESTKFGRNFIAYHQETIIIGQRNQVSIEKPMYRPGQCEAILDDIRPPVGNSPNMRGLCFSTSFSIGYSKSRYSAPVIVSVTH